MPTPEQYSFTAMRARCLNPNRHNYARYGGAGITVCERWSSFANFLADMGPRPSPRHTLHRKDPNGNYKPDNCAWATPEEQQRHRRDTKLTQANVDEMRSLYRSGRWTYQKLGERYGVHFGHIAIIVHKIVWK